jgi:hypothetical protein
MNFAEKWNARKTWNHFTMQKIPSRLLWNVKEGIEKVFNEADKYLMNHNS